MKKLFLLFLLFAVNAYTADFTPTPMTLTVPSQIEYKFGGSPLEIPFTLTGKSGAFWLVINTHGQADKINAVRNGNLGWHYVNKIDTTIYISDRFERNPGENTIVWDGKDENGNKTEPGEYDYYLWVYDNKSSDELVCNLIGTGPGYYEQHIQMYEKDNEGLPLAKPLLMGNVWSKEFSIFDNDIYRQGTQYKWTIGYNPMDRNLLQTSICSMYFPELPKSFEDEDGKVHLNPDFVTYGGSAFDPRDYSIFYQPSYKIIYDDTEHIEQQYFTVLKWSFVPDGEAILDTGWGGFNNYMWNNNDLTFRDACITNADYIYITDGFEGDGTPHNKLKCIDYDGELIFDKNFTEWYMNEQKLVFRVNNCSNDKMTMRQSDRILMISTWSCINQMINPSRLLDDPEDETDMVVFTNSNGDYFMDNGWQENLQSQWYCAVGWLNTMVSPEVYNTNLVRDSVAIDSNGFNFIFVWNYGIASFGVSTQDGTGIGYMSFSDDKISKSCTGGQICDNGSAYDGIYFSRDNYQYLGYESPPSTLYMAFDSAHGMITNKIAVEEKNPIQFKVAQNSPNPFNPSTTISFTIPEKGNVSVEIYNITGQKIKTLVNGYMSAGEHSVRWDAAGCSAGVYFYKVKAGKFERTMKMMLVR